MTDSAKNKRPPNKPLIVLLSIIAVILVGWMLQATAMVTMPVVFAFFIVVLVQPVQEWLSRRLPRKLWVLSVALTMLLIVATLALMGAAIWFAVDSASDKAPQYAEKRARGWEQIDGWAKAHKLPASDSSQLPKYLGQAAGLGLMSSFSVIAIFALVFFLVLLMSLEAPVWREKSKAAGEGNEAAPVGSAVQAISDKIRLYFYIRTVISAISGLAAASWLLIVGADFVFL